MPLFLFFPDAHHTFGWMQAKYVRNPSRTLSDQKCGQQNRKFQIGPPQWIVDLYHAIFSKKPYSAAGLWS